ncbi:helix-turn-helix domain-containing protein [Streptomyces sp. NPDC001795]|uniref:helix-turn-helix domain-containing protein n=1 Tax=Streptomyces sp. NPDC001795 TaxID=3154525 RepID=UPI00331ABEB3
MPSSWNSPQTTMTPTSRCTLATPTCSDAPRVRPLGGEMRERPAGGAALEGFARVTDLSFREAMRLQAADRFARGEKSSVIAAELRVSVRSVERWRGPGRKAAAPRRCARADRRSGRIWIGVAS